MTNSEAKKMISFYSNLFCNVIAKSIKENIDALKAGKLALELAGCPKDVAIAIEEAMIKKLQNG